MDARAQQLAKARSSIKASGKTTKKQALRLTRRQRKAIARPFVFRARILDGVIWGAVMGAAISLLVRRFTGSSIPSDLRAKEKKAKAGSLAAQAADPYGPGDGSPRTAEHEFAET